MGVLQQGIKSGGEPAAVQTLARLLIVTTIRVWTAVALAPLSRATFSGQTVSPNAMSKT
jgi:hypothetical protein